MGGRGSSSRGNTPQQAAPRTIQDADEDYDRRRAVTRFANGVNNWIQSARTAMEEQPNPRVAAQEARRRINVLVSREPEGTEVWLPFGNGAGVDHARKARSGWEVTTQDSMTGLTGPRARRYSDDEFTSYVLGADAVWNSPTGNVSARTGIVRR